MILVASYKERGNAEEQKAKLAMMGMQSRVEKVTIDNRDTFYRVRIGPERDLAAARSVVSELNANGIEGVVVKLK
jgi:cell division protein FtsN